jgi:hypothetical protein
VHIVARIADERDALLVARQVEPARPVSSFDGSFTS